MASNNKIVRLEDKIISAADNKIVEKLQKMVSDKNEVLEHLRSGASLDEISGKGHRFVGTL